jgi:hypothetical protein
MSPYHGRHIRILWLHCGDSFLRHCVWEEEPYVLAITIHLEGKSLYLSCFQGRGAHKTEQVLISDKS